jgi:hypothetical protein
MSLAIGLFCDSSGAIDRLKRERRSAPEPLAVFLGRTQIERWQRAAPLLKPGARAIVRLLMRWRFE